MDQNMDAYAADEKELKQTVFPPLSGEKFSDPNELMRCMKPLLKSLRLIGVYFTKVDERTTEHPEVPATANTAVGTTGGKPAKLAKLFVLPSVILAAAWLNVIRLLVTLRTTDVERPALIAWLSSVATLTSRAVLHTSYFLASSTGQLDRVLRQIRITDDHATVFRKMVVVFTAAAWNNVLFSVIIFGSYMFNCEGFVDYIMSPLSTIIDVRGAALAVVRLLYLVFVEIPSTATWVLILVTNHILSLVLVKQFQLIHDNIRRSTDSRGRFTGSITTIRRRYESVCSAVKTVDGFLMFGNIASFCCDMFAMIIMLYCATVMNAEDWRLVNMGALVAANVVSLVLATTNAVVVNHSVRF